MMVHLRSCTAILGASHGEGVLFALAVYRVRDCDMEAIAVENDVLHCHGVDGRQFSEVSDLAYDRGNRCLIDDIGYWHSYHSCV